MAKISDVYLNEISKTGNPVDIMKGSFKYLRISDEICHILRYYAASNGNPDYHSTTRNTPEDRRSYQYRGGSLKLRLKISVYKSVFSLLRFGRSDRIRMCKWKKGIKYCVSIHHYYVLKTLCAAFPNRQTIFKNALALRILEVGERLLLS
jgi:hypothetical protein